MVVLHSSHAVILACIPPLKEALRNSARFQSNAVAWHFALRLKELGCGGGGNALFTLCKHWALI